MDHLRRQAHDLARSDAVGGFCPLAIHPHLALAEQLFQPSMGQGGEMPAEPAIDADSVIVIGNDALFRHTESASATARRTGPEWTAPRSRRHRRPPAYRRHAPSASRYP